MKKSSKSSEDKPAPQEEKSQQQQQPVYRQAPKNAQELIRQAASGRRADALFKAMATDFLLREQFVTDPAQVLSEYVHGKNLTPAKAAVSNQLIYAIMSNNGLLHWIRRYATHLHGQQPSREQFIFDFSRAVVENHGHHVLIALARAAAEKESFYDFDEALLPILFSVFTGIGSMHSGTEMSTGTFATEQSGTHISQGGIFQSGTEMSTGTFATEQSGTHISQGGGIFETGTEMSTGTFATEQSGTHISQGGIFQSGTEMSTGTFATEQSGTHISQGGLFARYSVITLAALTQYATQLRNRGVLDVVFTK